MKKILSVFGLLTFVIVLAGNAFAGTVAGTLQVSANVVSACTVATSPANFGDVDGINYAGATGDVTVNCSANLPYHIALDAGRHYDGRNRQIFSNEYSVPYELVTPLTGLLWGDNDYSGTYPNGPSVSDTGNGTDQPHAVHASLWSFSGIPAGTVMTDTVAVTVHY